MRYIFFVILFIGPLQMLQAQNDRLRDNNTISWPQLHVSIPLGKGYDLLAEYQWRRINGFNDWQQSLLRTAIQFRLNEKVAVAAGYGWIETFVYGDFPIAANGNFPEHRLYEQLQLTNVFNKLSVIQRLRIEQRWLGKRATVPERKIEEWLFSHRFRYMLRMQHPLIRNQRVYLAIADELFVGAGKNVGANLFDQNRLMMMGGFKINDHLSVEAGYLSQTLIQSRRINNQTIVQHNRGLLISLGAKL